jgi:hypothetical protein
VAGSDFRGMRLLALKPDISDASHTHATPADGKYGNTRARTVHHVSAQHVFLPLHDLRPLVHQTPPPCQVSAEERLSVSIFPLEWHATRGKLLVLSFLIEMTSNRGGNPRCSNWKSDLFNAHYTFAVFQQIHARQFDP